MTGLGLIIPESVSSGRMQCVDIGFTVDTKSWLHPEA